MKHIITTFFLLFLFTNSFSQTRELIKLEDNLFRYVVYSEDGTVDQKGFYKKIKGEYVEHGLWKNSVGTKGLYKNGNLVWIKLDGKKYYYKQIELELLKRKVKKLEAIIASN